MNATKPQLSGFLVYHTHNSRRSAPGFPDLVLVRPPEIVFAELKSERGKLRPEQGEWLAALRACEGVEAHLWRPEIERRVMEASEARVEAIESEIDRIIEKRAAERKDASRALELWTESAERHDERRRRENRALWHDFHERMRQTHYRLGEEHEAKALSLLNGGDAANG